MQLKDATIGDKLGELDAASTRAGMCIADMALIPTESMQLKDATMGDKLGELDAAGTRAGMRVTNEPIKQLSVQHGKDIGLLYSAWKDTFIGAHFYHLEALLCSRSGPTAENNGSGIGDSTGPRLLSPDGIQSVCGEAYDGLAVVETKLGDGSSHDVRPQTSLPCQVEEAENRVVVHKETNDAEMVPETQTLPCEGDDNFQGSNRECLMLSRTVPKEMEVMETMLCEVPIHVADDMEAALGGILQQ
ncbi:sensor histidine kinase [Sesbania bispinosa]|nr:sensor histidine kinase [Sesbania bispinosa]